MFSGFGPTSADLVRVATLTWGWVPSSVPIDLKSA